MSLGKVLSATSKIGSTVASTASKLSSIFGSDEGSSSAIRDLYTNGFYGDTTNFNPSVFSRLFDEPTYLTFNVKFDFSPTMSINKAPSENEILDGTSYDSMPEPFLNRGNVNGYYSTVTYLRDYLGDYKRASMLEYFISALQDIQNNYPYYFTNIEGLGQLMHVTSKNGIRIKDDEGVLTIKCIEGLDMKITQLMQFYRKIVWDDVYQRWVLPDMMRYFRMKIYISEMRLFHSLSQSASKTKQSKLIDLPSSLNATSYDKMKSSGNALDKINNILNGASALSSKILGTNSSVTKVIGSANQVVDTLNSLRADFNSDFIRLCNNAINDVMPTICFECDMCEFSIDDTLSHIGSLSSSRNTTQMEPVLKIKVNKLVDKQLYPLCSRLNTSTNKYEISYNDKEMLIPYLNDIELAKGKDYSSAGVELTSDIRISKTHNRMNEKLDATKNNEGKLNYRLAHASAATSTMSLLYGILNKFTASDALSAATAIDSIKNFVYHSDIVNSVATSDEQKTKLKDKAFNQILKNISKSAATDEENALSALAEHILESVATDDDNKIEGMKRPDYSSGATDDDNEIKSDKRPDFNSSATDESNDIEGMHRTKYSSSATSDSNDLDDLGDRPTPSDATDEDNEIEAMEGLPYTSEATSEYNSIEGIKRTEYTSSATDDNNDIGNLNRPAYISKATDNNNGLEDIADIPYTSDATKDSNEIEAIERTEYSSPATDEHNVIEQIADYPYESTATEEDNVIDPIERTKFISKATMEGYTIDAEQSHKLESNATSKKSIDAEAIQTEYMSKATSSTNHIGTDNIQPKYKSDTTKDTNRIDKMNRPEYYSKATTDNKLEKTERPLYTSSATDEENYIETLTNDTQYEFTHKAELHKGEKLVDFEYHSTATEKDMKQKPLINYVKYKSAATNGGVSGFDFLNGTKNS